MSLVADSRTTRRWYVLQLLFAFLGAATSLYLLVQHTRLKIGIQDGPSFCSFGAHADCNVVNGSQYSEIFGIPLAALGVLYFLALFLLGAIQPPTTRAFRSAQAWMARLALLSLAIDLGLLGIQAFALNNFCLFCCLTYLFSAGHLLANFALAPVGSRSLRAVLATHQKGKLPSFASAATFSGVLASAFALYLYVSASAGSARVAGMEESKKVFLETWNQRPATSIPILPADPIWGNPQSKVQVVVFSDFECPHCQRAAFAMHTALAPEEGRVQVVFKNFPLDMSCNPLLKNPIHQNSCALAHLGFCAQQKGKFWDFHDRVFFKLSARELSSTRDLVYEGVKQLFSRKEFDDCLANPEALAHTLAGIEQGRSLTIDSTPAIFINGKKVTVAPTVDLIRELVQRELAATSM